MTSMVDQRPRGRAVTGRGACSAWKPVRDVRATLDRFAADAWARISVARCSIILRTGDSLDQVASNDTRAAACDRVETRRGAGPCIDAIEQLVGVVVEDLQGDARWPEWNSAARSLGFRSVIALPAYVDERTTVALHAYADRPDAWQHDQIIAIDLSVQELASALRSTTRRRG